MKQSRWSPSVRYLIKNLEMIQKANPIRMDRLPICQCMGYKWLWKFQEYGWVKIQSRVTAADGRCHFTWLTKKGEKMLATLWMIANADNLHCADCCELIDAFFRVPNDEWTQVMGNEINKVICRPCYEKRKKREI
jgi:hypothetical protein